MTRKVLGIWGGAQVGVKIGKGVESGTGEAGRVGIGIGGRRGWSLVLESLKVELDLRKAKPRRRLFPNASRVAHQDLTPRRFPGAAFGQPGDREY